MVTYNKETFIEKAKLIYDEDKYDYSEVVYIDNKTVVKIYCNSCKTYFYEIPDLHLNYRGCRNCLKPSKKTTIEFIESAILVHGFKFSYDKTEYVGGKKKVLIFCNNCKEYFWQRAKSHLDGQGCKKCSIKETAIKNTMTFTKFVELANKIHNNMYEFIEPILFNRKNEIKIFCKKCEKFFYKKPSLILNGRGCVNCNFSFGEKLIDNYLTNKMINHKFGYSDNTCKHKNILFFDFAIFDINGNLAFLIEFNGRQHYTKIKYFGDGEGFYEQQTRDKIKIDWAKNNNIPLLIIKYTEYRKIDTILDNFIKELNLTNLFQ